MPGVTVLGWILLLSASCIYSVIVSQRAKLRRLERCLLMGRGSPEDLGHSCEDLVSSASRDRRLPALLSQLGGDPSGQDFLRVLARFIVSTDMAHRRQILQGFVALLLIGAVGTASVSHWFAAASVLVFALCTLLPMSFLFRSMTINDFAVIIYLIDQWNRADPEGCKERMTDPETTGGFRLLYGFVVG
jgi:hypothetical protein